MAAETAKTQYIDAANGVKFAYRFLGKPSETPLVLHCHFRSNMDYWDPLLLNALAAQRRVIIFDQAGVGRSSGVAASTFQGWADNVISLIEALGIKKIDLFGFSMGGCAAQMIALTAPTLIRKLILGGTAASMPGENSNISGIVWPREDPTPEEITMLATKTDPADTEEALTFSFFPHTDFGRAAAKAYWKRVLERNVPEEPVMLRLLNEEATKNQTASYADFVTPNPRNSYDRLGELEMPVLVMNGDNDLLVMPSLSWELLVRIPNAQLIIYPKAGHGFLYQYAELVAHNVNMFLDGAGEGAQVPKL
ncbi:alpha/beta-hydrolase [Melanomma pulvis-pyrius CBS 109.77]|uniref:Alpha/beta-hydrolase n=1 Tax=Melanomma pulvis-pyrius CBS 109.77 TaxID=1314802 RepID=A0A6A6XWZ8_9PLEO|nr:alpha/beta-hydrolase [Melanomma pulvis-pyrius CBS 109.77]